MPHNRDSTSTADKPSDPPERVPAPDTESTQGGQSGREIIPNAADDTDDSVSS